MVGTENSTIFGIDHPARALSSVKAEVDLNRFLVGTLSLKQKNKIYVVDYDDETQLIHSLSFPHPYGEVWSVSCSPQNPLLFSSQYSYVSSGNSINTASLFKLNGVPSAGEFSRGERSNHSDSSFQEDCFLEKIFDLKDPNSPENESPSATRCVLWCPEETISTMASIQENSIQIWDVEKCALLSSTTPQNFQKPFSSASWNPHHGCSLIATTNETSIIGWDLRTMKPCFSIENAHQQSVRSLDFNPNKQYLLVSGGDDCRLRFWDVRKIESPSAVFKPHSHWVWKVQYNLFHDQLVLSSSSDSRVVLSSVVSLSSDPSGSMGNLQDESNDSSNLVDQNSPVDSYDREICVYEEHEDSVYNIEWSGSDPWIFASLSYDGRLVINHVPRDEKYKILL